MNNPFDYTPDARCREAFIKLTTYLDGLKESGDPADACFCRELEEGKMLGVLIATDSAGVEHTLHAFSGQIGEEGFHRDRFVEPVFDYLDPDGYFKEHERRISRMNMEICDFRRNQLAEAEQEYETLKSEAEATIDRFRQQCKVSKTARDARRAAGGCTDGELAAMIKESQFEKAELHRMKKTAADELMPYATRLRETQERLDAMKLRRRSASEDLQKWLFDNFTVLNARGERRSLSDIFSETSFRIPPSGAGECCGPKLLQAAYTRGWKPEAIAEYWYGKARDGEVRIHGAHYPACRGKCLPILTWMLKGLDICPPLESVCMPATTASPRIIYENSHFCVVDKPAGMLSVPGKGHAVSVQEWLAGRFAGKEMVRMAHRLDQDTSGLLIATFTMEAYKAMQRLFAMREVSKTYIAELAGDYRSAGKPSEGRIELPLSPDPLDRPRQLVDTTGGKEATTDYEFTGVSGDRSRILFHPVTGRTHQLRVHAASPSGLGMPICGDRLYGSGGGKDARRLMLHAQRIVFTFPLDNTRYSFDSPVPF